MPCQAWSDPYPEEVFANALSSTTNLTHSVQDLTHNERDSLAINPSRDEYVIFISHLLDKLFIDDLDELSDEFRSEIFKLVTASRKHRWLETEVMQGMVV